MRRRWMGSGVAGVVALGFVLAACGPLGNPGATDDELSAARMEDADRASAIRDVLDADEAAALERSGMSGLSVAPERDADDLAMLEPAPRSKAKKAEEMGFSIFVVAASLAAAAAPFFLF